MKILVCGGRNFNNEDLLSVVLDSYCPTMIIHGGAKGADSMAGQYSLEANIPCQMYPANWAKHGPAAGIIRNKQMLDTSKPDLVVAFPGGQGTRHMINYAIKQGYNVIEIENNGSFKEHNPKETKDAAIN